MLQLPQSTPSWLRTACDAEPTLVWLDTCSLPTARDRKLLSGFCNHTEVALCKAVVDMLLRLGVPNSGIGVTSPYVMQVHMLQKALQHSFEGIDGGKNNVLKQGETEKQFAGKETNIVKSSVMTIDSFQGQDKAVMVVSLVRSNAEKLCGDLLKDSRRINVALTRAKHKVVVIGDSSTVTEVALLHKVMSMFHSLGTVQCLDEKQICRFL